jgi:hypothetical protein
MRDPRHIAAELQKEQEMLKTSRRSYSKGMKRAMYTNSIDNFDTLDDFTSMNVHQDTISQLKKELNNALPLRD